MISNKNVVQKQVIIFIWVLGGYILNWLWVEKPCEEDSAVQKL
jgi:hypothetical protein